MNRLHFIADKKLLIRQALTSWLLLLLAVFIFTFVALILSTSISNSEIVIGWAFVAVIPFLISGHVFLKRNDYYIKKPSTSIKPNEIILVDETQNISIVDRPQIFNRYFPQFAQRVKSEILERQLKPDMTSLMVTGEGRNPIHVVIYNTQALEIKSAVVTDTLLRAISGYTVELAESIGSKLISEVIVSFSETVSRIEIERTRQRVTLNIRKLQTITELYAKAVTEAEKLNVPTEMKQELVDRLYGQYYNEMEKLVPKKT